MADHVLTEAQRCLQCKHPRCQEGCPIRTPIPEVISLMLGGKLDEAGRRLFENNPLTTVCALVCSHEKQCEGHCILGKKGAPVHFSSIEHYVSSAYAHKMTAGPAPSNGMRVAVVGGGPAGLTIAVELARKGYEITIFERRERLGGVLRYGIPAFRLPKEVLDDFEYRHLHLKGIRIRPNTTVGTDVTIDELFRDGYSTIFIGTGVWQPRKLGVRGESLGHVHYAIRYLVNPESYHLGKRVAVIGAGNAAMDVARTALRHGAEKVFCVSRSSHATADERERRYAEMEGVQFLFGMRPVEITGEGVILETLQAGVDDVFTPVPGTQRLYAADSVIIAISQGPRSRIVSSTAGLEVNEHGLLKVDECGRTTLPGVFASGDVVNGARTVVEAAAHSRRVAQAMDEYMQQKRPPSLPEDNPEITASDTPFST